MQSILLTRFFVATANVTKGYAMNTDARLAGMVIADILRDVFD